MPAGSLTAEEKSGGLPPPSQRYGDGTCLFQMSIPRRRRSPDQPPSRLAGKHPAPDFGKIANYSPRRVSLIIYNLWFWFEIEYPQTGWGAHDLQGRGIHPD